MQNYTKGKPGVIRLDEKTIEYAKKILKKIEEKFDVQFAVLAEMGNGTKDDYREKFLLIVSEDFAKMKPEERISKIKSVTQIETGIDLYPHTLLEFKNLLRRYQGYVFEAIEHGIILKDNGIFKKVRDAVKNNLRIVKIDPETIWELY